MQSASLFAFLPAALKMPQVLARWTFRMPVAMRVAILLAGVCPLGWTADPNPDANEFLDLSIDQLVQVEVPEVYGASKRLQKATEAPSSVTVVTAREIKLLGYRSLGDVLSGVRGMYITKNRYYEFLGVRGFSRPGDYNSRVLVLIDGARTNEGVYGGTFMDGAFPLDMDLIDRIEIIRGPGSSLYGTSAFFAVINVISKKAAQLSGVQLSAGAGSYATYQGRTTFGADNDTVDLVFSGSALESNGPSNVRFEEIASDASRNGGVVNNHFALRWQNLFVSLTHGDFRLEYAGSARQNEYGTGIFGTVFNVANEIYDSLELVNLQFDHKLDAESNLFARLGHNHYNYWTLDQYDYPPVTANQDRAKYDAVSLELLYSTVWRKRHKLTFGGEYIDHYRANMGNYDIEPYFQYLDVRRSFKTWALYAQDEWTALDRLTINLGARFDDIDAAQSALNPRLGLIYPATDASTFKLLYGSAFRAPNAWERFYESTALHKASTNLRSEKIRTSELVVEHRFMPQLFGIASVYQYRIKDLITQITDPNDGLIVFTNAGGAKSVGMDLELQGKWEHLEGKLSHSYQESRNSTGATLSNSPRNLIKLSLIAPLWTERLTIGGDIQHVSRRLNESSDGSQEVVAAYTIANATLHYDGSPKGLDISLGVKNLLNERYGDPTSIDDMADISSIPRDGRTYWLNLSLRF